MLVGENNEESEYRRGKWQHSKVTPKRKVEMAEEPRVRR